MPRSRLACFALLSLLVAPTLSHAENLFVATTGSPTASGNSPFSPVDLATGLARLDPGDIMRIAHGSYVWTAGVISVPNSVRIEGGFIPDTPFKDLSVPTTITINPPLQTVTVGAATVGYYAGLDLVGRSGVTIADLTLSVKPAGVSGTFMSRGITLYTVRLESCQNITFSRVHAVRGSASNGIPGATGANGVAGNLGNAGEVGSATSEDNCGRGGGGGMGGGGFSSTPGPNQCAYSSANGLGINGASGTSLRTGGSGGSGGSGGADPYFNGGLGGDGGRGGGGPGAAGGANGLRGQTGSCAAGNGGVAGAGVAGAAGSAYAPGNRPTLGAANRDVYFVPGGQAGLGGDGAGGGGGGGGGGGAGETGFLCDDGAGSGGGGGGGGGQGGAGGQGGWGGGSSYGFYLVSNGSNVRLTCSTFASGSAGTGGFGGDGGLGGNGGSRGNGGSGSSEIGAGGNGGNGSAGGSGGRGQDGANGESVDILLQSGTAAVIVDGPDVDGDGRADACDNCAGIPNPNQEDNDLDGIGNVCEAVVGVGGDDSSPLEFALHPIHPNPTRAGATIRFDVPGAGGSVALRVYDTQGRCVRALAEGWSEPGRRTLMWDARDARGAPVSAGLYFVRLSVADFTATRKLFVLQQ